jgi:hypothetical protein
MTNLSVQLKQETASLLIGSDLRTTGATAEWRRLNLPGENEQARERIDKLFPSSDVKGHVLDVLASGVPSENVAIRLGGDREERFLCASFYPFPSAAKPKKVLMLAWEMKAHLLLDGETGEVLKANEAAHEILGHSLRSPESSWFAEPLRSKEARATALAGAARSGSHYLGRFKHRRPDGTEVELESLLVPVEEHQQIGRPIIRNTSK